MKNLTLVSVLAIISLLFSSNLSAQELGGNFNENIDEPISQIDLLNASRVTWVRGFVNVTGKFLTNQDSTITGVKTVAINNFTATGEFVKVRQASNGRIKLIMSLKMPFEVFRNKVPKPGTTEMTHLMTMIEKFLISYNLGKHISILVMGNEPEWENGGDADDYEVFLNLFADTLVTWKAKHGWDFMVFAGSLNRVSELKKSTTIPAVVRVVNTNPNVDGIDLHVHAQNLNQCGDDLADIRGKWGVTKKIITTEFSMVRALDSRVNDAIGIWGTVYGYPTTMKMYEYLNQVSLKANAGTPVSAEEFLSFFHSRTWYPRHWYRVFYNEFKRHNAYAMIGRFSTTGQTNYNATSAMWNLGAIYSETFMGNNTTTGFMNGSPLVYPEFIAIADSLYGSTTAVSKAFSLVDPKIHPNPASDRVNIFFSAPISKLEVFDISGRLQTTSPFNGNSLDVSTLTSGMYILRISSGVNSWSKKITVYR
jgi:hypothetical protein